MGPQKPYYGYYGEQKKKFPIKIVLLIVGVLALTLTAVLVMGALLNQNSIGTQSARLSVRLNNLNTLTTSAAKQLNNGSLKKTNAETAIITDGVQANLVAALPKKVDKSIQANESDASDVTKLSNAALAGTYDTEYKQVLTQKLESITALLNEMYTKTHSKDLKNAINDDYKNYSAILADLNALQL